MNIYRLLLFVTLAVRASAHTITTGNDHPSDHSSQIPSRPPSYSSYSGTPPLHEGHSENSALSTQGAGAGASSGIGPGSSVASASSPHPPGTVPVPQSESAPSHDLSHSRHSSTTTSGDGIRTPSTSTNGGSLREESRVSVESGSGSDPRGPPPPYSSNPVQDNETTLTTNDGHHSASSQSDTRHSTHSTHPELTHPDTTHSRQSAAAPGQHSGSGSQETGLRPSTHAHERDSSGPQASSTTAANSYSNPRGRERLNLPVRPPDYSELYPNRRVGFNNLNLEQDPERITSTPRRQCLRRYACDTCVLVTCLLCFTGIGLWVWLSPSDSDSACPTWDGYGSYGSYGYGDGSYGGNGSSGCNTTTMMKKRGVGKERGGGGGKGGEEEDKGTCGVNDHIQIEGPCDCQAATGIIGRDGKLQELPRGEDGKGVKDVKHTKREVLKAIHRKRTTAV